MNESLIYANCYKQTNKQKIIFKKFNTKLKIYIVIYLKWKQIKKIKKKQRAPPNKQRQTKNL